ncbi:ABC transporter permease [Arthrobacter cryoconiti]|uniref:ABC transporter permease n=1 Tax=Arthrobacter cryoconiti TaxID=748907 RepID=A0ABV8R5J3_9MICC|nr:ABC transporter permease [Arthrobacter cryoconiti]MCC9069962.1 ABC transporter permease [Arthrobacter cryoconiti]
MAPTNAPRTADLPLVPGTGGGTMEIPENPTSRKPHKSGSRKLSRKAMLSINFLSVAAGIFGWWLVSAIGVQGLPGPVEVLERGRELIADGTLAEDSGASLARVLTGFALGTLLAIPVGFLMGWYTIARGIIEPYVQFFRTIPPLAIIPLAIVTMGIGEVPKVFVIFLAAFLSCVISTFQGVVGVENTLINAARVLGANSWTVFIRVVIPASSPFILVGMRIGLGAAWATVVAAELIAAPNGLGFRMQQAQLYYDLPTIFVSLITIGILGLIMDRLLLMVEARLTRWQERR